MKTAKKVGIICWSAVALLLVSVLIWGIVAGPQIFEGFSMSFNNFNINEENAKIVNTYSVPIEDFEEINIDWRAGYVKISEYDGKEIQLIERTQKELSSDKAMKYQVSNGVLNIKSSKSYGWSFFSFGEIQKILDINLPKGSVKEIARILVNTASADVYLNDMNLNEFSTFTASGDISVENSDFSNFTAEAISGDICLKKINAKDKCAAGSTSGNLDVDVCNANSIKLNSTSGEVDIKNSVCETFYAESVSGDINSYCKSDDVTLNSTSGDIMILGEILGINANSVSGEIRIESGKLPQALKAESTSGNIYINIPEDKSGFTVDFSTVSGDLESILPLSDNGQQKIYGNGEYKYSFETVSGDVIIKNYSD